MGVKIRTYAFRTCKIAIYETICIFTAVVLRAKLRRKKAIRIRQ